MLTAIIVAAGSSKRVGFDKLFSKLGDRSVLEHALAAFEEAESVSGIIVVCRDPKLVQDAINRAGGRKVRAVVRGGKRRQDSVQAGLKELAENSEVVGVHVSAIEHAGGSIVIVPAQDHNLKITYAGDLPIAEFILKQRHSSSRV